MEKDLQGLQASFGKISDSQFKLLSNYLASKYGLRISEDKRVLLESRIIKRLSALSLTSIDDYVKHLFEGKTTDKEYKFFIDIVTTHKTYFFRENNQLEYFKKIALGYYAQQSSSRQMTIWSAGCSSGEEVYSIGIILNELGEGVKNIDYKIIGTDISIPILEKASVGCFSNDLQSIPDDYKKKYFIEKIEGKEQYLKFNHPAVKSRIQLARFNLNKKEYNLPFHFDFIFCRNVIIYFDAKTRAEVLKKMVDKLRPGGLLFLGHSETAIGTSLPLKNLQPAIYQKM
jgi:chemotaxis protein methyltransferase CheR